MSLSPEVIDAMVANGATVEMLAAVMKAELAVIAKQQADADAQALVRRTQAAEKKRRQRAGGVARPDMSPGRPGMSPSVPGTSRDIAGRPGTIPETKVSPTPPSKTQTLVIPPIVPQNLDGSPVVEAVTVVGADPADLFDAALSPSARRKQAKALRLASDVEFAQLWNIATQPMRKRGKSQAVVYPAWLAAKERLLPDLILAALRRYVTEDEDVQRGMGQPGLHRWLNDRVYEQWLPEVPQVVADAEPEDVSSWSDERWTATVDAWRRTGRWLPGIGPPPDDPDTQAPPKLRYPSHRTAA